MNSRATVLDGFGKAIEEAYCKDFTGGLIKERLRAESEKVLAEAKSNFSKLNAIKTASSESDAQGASSGLTVVIGSGFQHSEGDGGFVGQVVWHGSIPELLEYAKKELARLGA